MGLDVYVYKYENFADTERRLDAYEEASRAAWEKEAPGEYKTLSDGQIEAARALERAEAVRLGLAESGNPLPSERTQIEQDSKAHPGHMFKVGYFRSSYNEGGIQRVLRNALGDEADLDWIFRVTRESPYKVLPNWSDALERAKDVRTRFAAWIKETGGLRVASMDFFASELRSESMVTSPENALKAFMKTRGGEKRSEDFSSFSNAEGHYFLGEKPLQVRAVLTGKRESIFARLRGEKQDEPCAYVIYEADLTWYQQALDVVVETCEWVLAQGEPEKFYLHWSG